MIAEDPSGQGGPGSSAIMKSGGQTPVVERG
jgi:hypothetical protein